MKIRSNLLQGARPIPARHVAIAAWILAAALAITTATLLADALALRDTRAALEQRLDQLEAHNAQARTAAPPRAELEAMARRVQALNALTEVRGIDASELLIWLERKLPADVQLARLHHRARDGETRLVAEAWAIEPLAKLLRDLENEPRFAEVLLARQGTRAVHGKAAMVQFEIRIRHKT
jgi:hypothetical protein